MVSKATRKRIKIKTYTYFNFTIDKIKKVWKNTCNKSITV